MSTLWGRPSPALVLCRKVLCDLNSWFDFAVASSNCDQVVICQWRRLTKVWVGRSCCWCVCFCLPWWCHVSVAFSRAGAGVAHVCATPPPAWVPTSPVGRTHAPTQSMHFWKHVQVGRVQISCARKPSKHVYELCRMLSRWRWRLPSRRRCGSRLRTPRRNLEQRRSTPTSASSPSRAAT